VRESDVWLWNLMSFWTLAFWGFFYVYLWWTGGEYR
jgi:hypothetical protein